MNRFFLKSKSKDSSYIEPASPEIIEEPALPKLSARKTRKWKKGRPEPKPELDLSAALPSTDNFRTSLMMPNLSARFSMLREQDNPNSKLGKASDDSVLHPTRQSRLKDFELMLSNVSNRVEDHLLQNPVRPPFAFDRQDSISSVDGYGTDDDSTYTASMMSRARPGEGNTLFGGRQKIYRIPTSGAASTKSLAVDTRGMGGRPLYEDDVSLSAFQKYREERRTQRSREGEAKGQDREHEDVGRSPSLGGYNKNRETVSSTTSASAPSIAASTAATSVNSQTARPSSPAGRAPSLERSNTKSRRLYENGLDQHMYEQQSSALTRLNSIQKQRNLGAKGTAPYTLQARNVSTPNDRHNRSTSPSFQTTTTATTPSSAPQDKLTTFGSTRHPKSSGSSPTPPPPRSPQLSGPNIDSGDVNAITLAIEPNDYGKATAMGTFNRPKRFDEQQYLQRQMRMRDGSDPTPSTNPSPPTSKRSTLEKSEQTSSVPKVRQRSGTTISGNRNVSSAFEFFQNAVNRMQAGQPSTERKQSQHDAYGTFFSHITGSDSEEEEGGNQAQGRSSKTPGSPSPANPSSDLSVAQPPLIIEHPATASPHSPEKDLKEGSEVYAEQSGGGLNTPEPTTGGLSSFVRQHLRQTSTQSSITDPPSPVHWTQDPEQLSALADVLPLSLSPSKPGTSKYEWQTPELKNSENRPPWEQDLRKGHHREASTETQAEREAFADELAHRQKAIQEALKTKVDSESRSTSPSVGSSASRPLFDNALRPFALLRSKSSRENVSPSSDILPSRTLKLSAFGKSSTNASSVSLADVGERLDSDDLSVRGGSKPSLDSSSSSTLNSVRSRHPQESTDRHAIEPQHQSSSQASQEDKGRTLQSSGQSSARSPSRSETSSARSLSRSRGTVNHVEVGELQGMTSGSKSTSPSDMIRSQSQASTLLDNSSSAQSISIRSGSRSSEKDYFNGTFTSPHALQTSPSATDASPRTFPLMPRSPESTPALSRAPTPTTQTSAKNGIYPQQPAWQSMQGRKKSVQKSDISEPIFLSSTCNVDVVNLPPGASLKNGQNEGVAKPALPAGNPRRRATLGRSQKSDTAETLSARVYTPEPPRRMVSHQEINAKARQRLGMVG